MRATVPVLWDFLLSSQTRPNSLSPVSPSNGPGSTPASGRRVGRSTARSTTARSGRLVSAVIDHRPVPLWLNDEAGMAVAGSWI
jgi:hypothetical protein